MVSGIIEKVCIRTFQNRIINNLINCLVWSLKLVNSVVIESIKPFVEDNAVILDLRHLA